MTATFRGFPDRIAALAFSPDGSRLAVSSSRGCAIFRMMSPQDEPVMIYERFGRSLEAMAYAPDGERLAHCFSSYSIPDVDPFQMVRMP